jgi:hypothetical protein
MTWVAVATAGAAVIGGAASYIGNKKAADAAADTSDAAIAEQRRQFDTIRNDTAPYRQIGTQALNQLASIYGYSTLPSGGWQGQPIPGASQVTINPNAMYPEQSFGQTGAGRLLGYDAMRPMLNPASYLGEKLFGISPNSTLGKVLDPLGFGLGKLFGSKKGDEKRNLKAFQEHFKLYDLGDGMLALEDGTIFPQSKLEELAGTWYGAKFAPDGDQEGWQQKYDDVLGRIRNAPWNARMQQTALQAPAAQAGQPPAQPQTAPDYSAFYKSPDFEFRRNEGLRGINNSFAARGGALSGNALRALTQFNSDLAAGEFGNYFNRQAALAGIGQTATNTSAQAGLATGARIGNALMEGGNARASGIAGQYDAIGGALSGLAQGVGYWNANRSYPGISYVVPQARRV